MIFICREKLVFEDMLFRRSNINNEAWSMIISQMFKNSSSLKSGDE